MRGFLFGLILGLASGGGGTYWYLSRVPAGPVVVADAGVEDAGARSKKRRKRRKKRRKGSSEPEFIDERVVLSPGDKALIWKGPSTKVPERSMDFESADQGRTLSSSEIQSGVNSGADAVSACIADARGSAELRAKITLKLLVAGSGGVSKVRVRAPRYLIANGFYSCASRAAKRMNFAGAGLPTEVTVPFDLGF